jgi:putative pyruvate formate lyase activating enzyme
MIISSHTIHHGEEPIISGTNGSGTIFFGNCNLSCTYCQNFQISQNIDYDKHKKSSVNDLVKIMLQLQSNDAHNINLVSPTHFVHHIAEGIYYAKKQGLNIPIVYNSNGYENVEILELLEGLVDIYLPDIKYSSSAMAEKYSEAKDYVHFNKLAIKEMYRQTGEIKIDSPTQVAHKGTIVRHLVLPNNISGTDKVMDFIADEVSTNLHVSLMSQYYPTNKSTNDIDLNRYILPQEYEKALIAFESSGLKNGWIQELQSHQSFRPDFNKDKPFNNE